MKRFESNFHESLGGHIEVPAGSDRQFGIVFAVVFAALAAYQAVYGGRAVAAVLTVLAVGVGLVAWRAPHWLAPANRLWTRLSLLLAAIVTPVVLGILFFVVFTPSGLLRRWLVKDPLGLRVEREASSYWVGRHADEKQSMARQF